MLSSPVDALYGSDSDKTLSLSDHGNYRDWAFYLCYIRRFGPRGEIVVVLKRSQCDCDAPQSQNLQAISKPRATSASESVKNK